MIIPVCIPRQGYLEELKQMQAEVVQIKDNMPRKSAFQEEFLRLQDQVVQDEATIKSQANLIGRLQNLNEKLIEYIGNIEEIKSGGGISVGFETRHDLTCNKMLTLKTIKIPEVTLVLLRD